MNLTRVALVVLLAAATGGALAPAPASARTVPGRILFQDDFERDLSAWAVQGTDAVSIHRSGGVHGGVLRLQSNGDVHALIRGSEAWGNVAIEGDLLFAQDVDSYLGFVYNFRARGTRTDFGLVYLKYGPRVYLRPNPHRDYNVSRKLYPEYQAPLLGAFQTQVGVWQKFRVEVVNGASHFFIGETKAPQLTFPIAEAEPGRLGFQPRSVGGDVWIDNVRVTALESFSYTGAPQPAPIAPDPSPLSWEILGPFPATRDQRAIEPNSRGYRPFPLDPRTAIETGRVVDFHGPNTVAYFRAVVPVRESGPATLRLSTIDDLALWLNGRFQGFIPKQANAWPDYWSNPAHQGEEVPLTLRAGDNTLVVRVRGGTYASGGFFARVEIPSAAGGS